MNLNQIQYLLAIHKYGTIRQAAEHLFVSAPSISVAVRHLEEEIGCTLLLRHHNGVTFTDEGEEAIQLMSEIQENVNKLYHLQPEQDLSVAGSVSMGVSLHAKAPVLLPSLFKLHESYPAVSVHSEDMKSHDILNAILESTLDLGLIHFTNLDGDTFTDVIRHNDLQFGTLYKGNMCFVVGENHPLTQRDPVTMKDVLEYPFFYYCKTDFTKVYYRTFQNFNANCQINEVTDRDMFRVMQHNSLSVTAMPSLFEICGLKQFTGLSFLHISDFDYRYVIGWLHNSAPLTLIEKAIIGALQQTVDRYKK